MWRPRSHLQMYSSLLPSDSNEIMQRRRLCEQHGSCLTPEPGLRGAPVLLSVIAMETVGAAGPAKASSPPPTPRHLSPPSNALHHPLAFDRYTAETGCNGGVGVSLKEDSVSSLRQDE